MIKGEPGTCLTTQLFDLKVEKIRSNIFLGDSGYLCMMIVDTLNMDKDKLCWENETRKCYKGILAVQ